MEEHSYIAIDLKSFYASVECKERGYDPLDTNLVVADAGRTNKTICLAVSPSLKAYGIPGRARLFEVVSRVKEANARRRTANGGKEFTGTSCLASELERDANLALDYIVAPPRMALYMKCSTEIYDIYLHYVAPEDIHVYSVDEVFMDVTSYLRTYGMTAKELATEMMKEVYETTGITATAGVGTNLYLCKIAMDIVAKHMPPNEDGARIAELDEMSYRRFLWGHRPLTDFWRVGRGIARKLEANGLYTMGDIARCSLGGQEDFYNEELLYKLFGVNAELLIDHAWGWEPCTMAHIKAYKPQTNSISSGQVLTCPYTAEKARLIVQEMIDALALDLVDKQLVTDQIVLTVGYDVDNLLDPERRRRYHGQVTIDGYGREVPKHAHGTVNLPDKTSSTKRLMNLTMDLYDRIIDWDLLVRRITICANRIIPESQVREEESYHQLDLFSMMKTQTDEREAGASDKEKKLQQAVLDIKKRYGKNAVLRGMNFKEGATARDRNRQIGGHKA
ncbi:MAG: DNA methylase [Lachnospiraceae bacterium]|nr:DNA methylase [Lachnospiraceae bacterium]